MARCRQLDMSLPRAIIPGRCYLITRRCSERRFFLRPDRETNNAFVYCMALALGFRRAPGFQRLRHNQYAKLVRDHVDQAVAKSKAERLHNGIKLVGRKVVLRQHWNAGPYTLDPRRGLSPRVACRNKWARIAALQRNMAFSDPQSACLCGVLPVPPPFNVGPALRI